MNTSEIVALIRQKKLGHGVYPVSVQTGVYSDIMGGKVLVYTDEKPDSELLSFSVNELLLVIQSAKELTTHISKLT